MASSAVVSAVAAFGNSRVTDENPIAILDKIMLLAYRADTMNEG